MKAYRYIIILALCVFTLFKANAQVPSVKFNVLVLYENGGHHVAYSKAARVWLNKQAADNKFTVKYINDTKAINDKLLNRYQLFIQLDYPPYGWEPQAAAAFQKYIEQGRGGWIGFHHATLLGQFDGFPLWQWFSGFMGNIQFKNYIATFAQGTVNIEDKQHSVMKGIQTPFIISQEEWYTYNQSPRANVQVLASVDENSYRPKSTITMGDHPVVWTNNHYPARNVYIFMGHSPALFKSQAYCKLFHNAILWAAGK